MALIDNQTSYWKSDSATSYPDAVGSNDGTINGATYTSSGKINGAYSFDGVNDNISLGDIDIVGDTTINLRCSITSAGTVGIVDKFNLSTNPLAIRQNSSGYLYATIYDGSTSINATATSLYNDSTFHMITTVRDYTNSTLYLYIDGIQAASITDTLAEDITNGINYYLGMVGNSSSYLNGKIDEVGIWDRALSSTEVSELYNSGSGLQYPYTATSVINDALFFGCSF